MTQYDLNGETAGGTNKQPWIKTSSLFGGGVEINDVSTPWPWPKTSEAPHIAEVVADLERRVARLETMQRRKPKRKAGR